jgi:prepilin-type N-terminal cleavage/methylation domain-containing protein
MKQKSVDKLGFTLVELSIVLVIIGLIVGGIFVAQELIHASKIRSTVSQYNRYVSSIYTFLGKYQYLPGDIIPEKADAYGLATCYTSGGSFINNAGDGFPPDGCIQEHFVTSGNGTIDRSTLESSNFFQHLSASGIVEGGYTMRGWITGDVGDTYAVSQLDTMFYPDNVTAPSGDYSPGASSFILGVSFQGFLVSASLSNIFDRFSPYDAYGMDSKIDDGSPSKGIFFVLQGYSIPEYNYNGSEITGNNLVGSLSGECCAGATNCSSSTDEYDITREAQLCTVAIQWGG